MKSYYQQTRSKSSELSLQVRSDIRPAIQQLNFSGVQPLEFGKPGSQLVFKAESDDLFCPKLAETSFAPHEIVDNGPAHFKRHQVNQGLDFGGKVFNPSAAPSY
jgi:hypothetical protein